MSTLEPPQHVGLLCRSVPCVCPPLSGHRHPDWIAYEEAAQRADDARRRASVGTQSPDRVAEAVLVAHQRHRGGCLCGWADLGKSLPGHQAAILREAGAFGAAGPAGCDLDVDCPREGAHDPHQWGHAHEDGTAHGGTCPGRPPWRFDVPDIPEHVTCVEGKSGRLIVRVGTRWAAWDKRHERPFESFASFDAFLAYAPFVECPDPRKDTT